MLTKDEYWETLTVGQKCAFHRAMEHADDLGVEIVIADAVDIWMMLPAAGRGPKPEEVQSV